ncbi:MAG: peptidylprolyl isomerase [bacterium]
MIYIFRKEMRKWKNVLWLVLASFVIGGASFLFVRRHDPRNMPIGKVGGQEISLKEYQTSLNEIKTTIDMYKNYAKAYGAPVDMFLNMFGLSNPEQAAFDKCVRGKLVEGVQDSLNIQLNDEIFNEELAKTIPGYLVDATGKINIKAYRNYLNSRLGITVSDYEDSMKDHFAQEIVGNAVRVGSYSSESDAQELFSQNNLKKSFQFIHFPFEHFLNKTKSNKIEDKEIKEFFHKNKENYRVGKKVKIDYWVLDVDSYEKKVKIDDGAVENYYERNKSSLFRIPPKVKVRHILLRIPEMATPDQVEIVKKKAKEIEEKLAADPGKFVELVNKYSQDEETKGSDGLIDFFQKGKYDTEFEKAAFRLKEKDEISKTIKTRDGLEIIQLVDRIAAAEKPLEDVRNQIIKTLKAKKGLNNLKGDIESLLYKARTNIEEIAEFMNKNNIKKEQTDWLSDSDTDGENIKNLLAQRFFSKQASKKSYGYLVNDSLYTVYLLNEKKDSFIPKFEDIKDKILQDLYEQNTKKDLKKIVRNSKKQILLNEKRPAEIAADLGLKIKTTGMIEKGAKISGISEESDFSNAIFILNDKNQVAKQKINKDYYLVQLINQEDFSKEKFEKEKKELLEKIKETEKNVILEAFLSSLMRNSKIERFDKIQQTKEIEYPDY